MNVYYFKVTHNTNVSFCTVLNICFKYGANIENAMCGQFLYPNNVKSENSPR